MGVFKPALIVVDFQEDFCPPNGSLAVPHGRDIAPVVNSLLALPFALKIATRDWHPMNHVSFAVNHAGATPFESTAVISDPRAQGASSSLTGPGTGTGTGTGSRDDGSSYISSSTSYTTRLWPVHCVQDSPGAQLVPELDTGLIDHVLDKGTDPRVETYSAFYDPFHLSDSGLADVLRGQGITHVYTVGLALEYCVKATTMDAAAEGFKAYVIEEGTRAIDVDGVPAVKRELERAGVKVVGVESDEVDLVRRRRML